MQRKNMFINYVTRAKVTRQLQQLSAVAIVALALLTPSAYAQSPIDANIGDAPDSANSVSQKIESNPGNGIIANYPTISAVTTAVCPHGDMRCL